MNASSDPSGPTSGYITAAEAVAELRITRATLYAYVSRGWVRSVPGRGRSRLYATDDIKRLRARSRARSGHGPAAGSALRWGDPVISSAITQITPDGPRYRGHLAVDLVEQSASYEQVAELLWSGVWDTCAPWQLDGLGVALRRMHDGLRPTADPLACVQFALASIAAKSQSVGLAAAAERTLAAVLIHRLGALAGLCFGLERVREAAEQTGLARTVVHALGGPARANNDHTVAAVEAALILSADHELNTSAFTARVVASTGADLHACLTAALAALSGPLHGGACRRVEGLFGEATVLDRPADVVRHRLSRGEPIPGFGHPFYPQGDPRARLLLARAMTISPQRTQISIEIADAMRAAGHPQPALDFGLVALANTIDLPPGSATLLFAIGRTAGWIAHIAEQRSQGFLLRPRARYTGVGG